VQTDGGAGGSQWSENVLSAMVAAAMVMDEDDEN